MIAFLSLVLDIVVSPFKTKARLEHEMAFKIFEGPAFLGGP